MRTQDAQTKIVEYAGRLDEKTLMAKLREFERGGLPGQSMSDGRGGEPPLPMIGRTDRQIIVARDAYQRCLTTAALELEKADRIQEFWCKPLLDDTTKAEKLKDEKPGTPCRNVNCDHWMTGFGNDRPRDGRCMACNQHWKRHGTERDPRERVTSKVTKGEVA